MNSATQFALTNTATEFALMNLATQPTTLTTEVLPHTELVGSTPTLSRVCVMMQPQELAMAALIIVMISSSSNMAFPACFIALALAPLAL